MSREARKVYVRLTSAWTDPAGAVHGAGDVVDIDPVTLAELEEQGIVDNEEEGVAPQAWVGPTEEGDKTASVWVGPTDEPDSTEETEAEEQAEE